MMLIRDIVQKALATNYLTVEAEEQLRLLLRTKYEIEDLKAFMQLQQAAMEGHVRQESRLLIKLDLANLPSLSSATLRSEEVEFSAELLNAQGMLPTKTIRKTEERSHSCAR